MASEPHQSPRRWRDLFDPGGPRLTAGIMSGTSLDGIDVAISRLEGSGRGLRMEFLGAHTTAFPDAVAQELRDVADAESYPVDRMNVLNARLALAYEEAVRAGAAACGVGVSRLALVGCHGQTVRHQPVPREFAGAMVSATLQLGSGSALAALLGVPVVSDFRSADVALGGQGAPLVPYFDYVTLGSPVENRIALNLGGIANLTTLPAGAELSEITAFDTGPANMVIDGLARRLLDVPFDRDGATAAAGQPLRPLVREVLSRPFFASPPPKSAGRRSEGAGFGAELVTWLLGQAPDATPEDLLSTAVAITVESIALALDRFVPYKPEVVIASGGGCRNAYLMKCLRKLVGRVETSGEFGVDAAYKEALAFAVLAHEAVNGVATGIPSVTGASRPAVLGSISWP